MSFIKEIFILLLKYPVHTFKAINIENIKTLLFAVRNEPLGRVYHNITKKFQSQSTLEQLEINSSTNQKLANLTLTDKSLIANQYILLNAQINSKLGIKKINIHHISIGDVVINTNENHINKVFELSKEWKEEPLKLIVFFEDNSSGICQITLTKSLDYQSLNLNQQYQIYRLPENTGSNKNQLAKIDKFNLPSFSIIIPTYNADINHFVQCLESLVAQDYDAFEVCIYDDGSTQKAIKKFLSQAIDRYPSLNIQLDFGEKNQGIANASNAAIKLANNQYIAFLDQDDQLDSHALNIIAKNIYQSNIKPVLIYSDEDHIDASGKHCDPIFKPDYSPSTLRSTNYINHIMIIRKSEGDKIGWFRSEFDGAQDYDLLLRLTEKTANGQVMHIPEVLYHWRKSEKSIANRPELKTYVYRSAQRALQDYIKRNNIAATVSSGKRIGTYNLTREVNEDILVSIIIPFKDELEILKTCIESLLNKTSYHNYEIILISNNSKEQETLAYCNTLSASKTNITFLEYNVPFNYSEINNEAVKYSNGEYLLFLNNDTEIINAEWLTKLAGILHNDKVGVVGAKLLYPDDTIQHAGIILGMNGNAGYINKSIKDNILDGYYMGITKNVIAVTGACLLTKRSLFKAVSGFDESLFKVNFNDVDYCLKIHDLGYEIIYCPEAELYHYESFTRGKNPKKQTKELDKTEIKNLRNKWKVIFDEGDPYYNPNLSLYSEKLALKLY